MMLTIHGLPLATKYHDVKVVIKRECNLADFILDNLVSDEDGCKKIRIGVADESEGAHLMKCLNGYRMGGQMLRVVPVGKASLNSAPQPAFEQRDNFPPRNDYLSHMTDYNQSRPSQPTQPWATNQWPQNQSANTTNNFNYQQSTPNQPYIHQQPQTQRMVQPFSNRMPVQEPMYTGGVRPMAPKALMPDPQQPHHMDSRSHVLRSIEIVDQPVNRANVSARYPGNQNYEQQKPITIMKNNFQGPTQYPGGQQNASQNYPIQSQAPTWQLQGAQQKPHPFSKDNPPFKPQYDDDRKYPDRHSSTKNPENRDLSNYEKSRGFSPRRSPMGRGMSPGRKMSPDRNIHRLHGGSDRRTLIGPDGRLHDPDGRSHGQDGRSHGQDGRSHGQDGRNRGPDKRPHSSDGRSHGPDGRPHGPDGRSKGPDGRPHGPDGRSQGPDGRPRGGPEGRHGLLGPGGRPLAGPDERRMSPGKRGILSGRRSPPSDRRTSPSSKRVSPSERRFSPPGRRISPPGRRISPPGRRISPSGRRMSPSGRQMSPPGRRMSPSRRISPSGRRISPGRRLAERTGPPNHRLESPPRPPPSSRYSPSRHHSDKLDSAHSIPKQVRPAYEPDSQAPNQAMYSGGYRPNIRENVQYPKPGGRQGEHHHSPWQDRENPVFSSKKLEEDRRERMPMSRGSDRLLDHGVELKRQPSPRKSRSPGRRDRSPLRDRYRRHSPSPRSPRRSWALEKRRSPVEAPPPPIWPGPSTHDEDKYTRSGRPDFHDKDEPSKPMVWERPTFHQKNEDPHRDRRSIPEAFGDDSSKLRRDLGEFPKRDQPKFSPREDFRRQEISEQKRHSDREEYREFPSHSEREARGNMRRQELLRRPEERLEDYRKRQQIFDKELDDVYNRAVEFAKKTDEMRREDRRRAASDERRREDTQREERHFHREKEPRRDFHDARPEDRHSRHEERPRSRYSDEYNRESREREWNTGNVKKWTILDPEVKIKRDKASEEICNKILQKHLNVIHSEEMKHHITEQLKGVLFKRLHEMFGNDDVSFIEMVIKFSSSIAGKEEDKLFNDAMSKLPPQLRYLKRSAPETSEVPAKTFKHSSDPNLNDSASVQMQTYSWNLNTPLTDPVMNVDYVTPLPVPPVLDMNTLMTTGFLSTFETVPYVNPSAVQSFEDTKPVQKEDDGFHLYLCKDDFEQFFDVDMESLKEFLVTKIFKVTESSGGWAPNFTFKGLQSNHRYELVTDDPMSREWLIRLDFSEFTRFNVLVYTNEELWYERAAIWLPGHSRYRFEEPFVKLRLQNRNTEQLNIGKWKLVKKIVTVKGTRLYVDMPPSSARVLEKNKMMLSYELQKVNVILRVAAVDKDAFDAGLLEQSVLSKEAIRSAIANSPMPSLNQNDPKIIKIELKGSKTLTIQQARKIKEMVIYNMFKYHEDGGENRTDFEKYGFCSPNHFGVLPANPESKRWLLTRNIGKLNRRPVVVVGGDDRNIRFFTMYVTVPYESNKNMSLITERLKQSNQGVKNLNFNLWKPKHITVLKNKSQLEVDIDMESVETIITMNFTLDYLLGDRTTITHTAHFRPNISKDKLMDTIKKYKSEQMDSYVVANMELDSDSDDVECLGEVYN
ncbi:uncharacterized protein LOC113523262 isoform X1 [Galleria mellonella]|uniref:Uncharacterized protein LOC113523262 isoform X1 n=1 Tax=Galleria mellonella TaxID=7137 RepID=A0A6J1X9H9_GALME|nr:uncharacterized protein LOC113523262 isoform X1 [Galleria mellonella]